MSEQDYTTTGKIPVKGILELVDDGKYGFLRHIGDNGYAISSDDAFVRLNLIRSFDLREGDLIEGIAGTKRDEDSSRPLIYINSINGRKLSGRKRRPVFDTLTPIFPNERIQLSLQSEKRKTTRLIDVVSPIGKGQRGMIASPPKAGKTTILKDIASSMLVNCPEAHIFVLLIDERPEEVTDFRDHVCGDKIEILSSTFDKSPEHHKRVAEMTLQRAKRLVEEGDDVVILMDSITRLVRAYNLIVTPSGRTLSGGIDPASFFIPKKFFGAARNLREGGSLTIIATALIETGSKMDDVIYEEFKGTGNMELVLNRKLQEQHIFPAIDIAKSGTRRDDLLLTAKDQRMADFVRKEFKSNNAESSMQYILRHFTS